MVWPWSSNGYIPGDPYELLQKCISQTYHKYPICSSAPAPLMASCIPIDVDSQLAQAVAAFGILALSSFFAMCYTYKEQRQFWLRPFSWAAFALLWLFQLASGIVFAIIIGLPSHPLAKHRWGLSIGLRGVPILWLQVLLASTPFKSTRRHY